MSTPKLVALGLSIALVGSAVLLLGPSSSASSRAAATATKTTPAQASAAPSRSSRADPGQELAELRHQVRVLTEATDQAEAERAADSAAGAAPTEAPTESAALDPAQLVAALDVHLRGEGHDAAATSQASAHITDQLARAEAGELLSLDCGQTLCRSTLGFGDTDQRDARLADIGSLMPWDADGFFSTDPDDELRVSVYFTRDAMALPTAGQAS